MHRKPLVSSRTTHVAAVLLVLACAVFALRFERHYVDMRHTDKQGLDFPLNSYNTIGMPLVLFDATGGLDLLKSTFNAFLVITFLVMCLRQRGQEVPVSRAIGLRLVILLFAVCSIFILAWSGGARAAQQADEIQRRFPQLRFQFQHSSPLPLQWLVPAIRRYDRVPIAAYGADEGSLAAVSKIDSIVGIEMMLTNDPSKESRNLKRLRGLLVINAVAYTSGMDIATDYSFLSGLSKLKGLNIAEGEYTGEFLQDLRSLEYLDAHNTMVGDQVLKVLAQLPKIKYVNVAGTECTEQQVVAFREALKYRCEVVY